MGTKWKGFAVSNSPNHRENSTILCTALQSVLPFPCFWVGSSPGGLGNQCIGTGSVASLSAAKFSPPLVSSMYQVGRVREPMYWYRVGSVTVCVTDAKKPRRLARLFYLCWHYLSSRQVTLQVLSAQMSLTSVFGMGTGGPSSQSIPTMSDGCYPSLLCQNPR